MEEIRIRGARTQPQEYQSRPAARQADRDHRPVRFRQVLARVRHPLRGRPASLRRVAVGLRPPVPATDGKAGRRPDRGPVPAISIEQKATSHNPRSTVGTVTEIHDYLRLLFARAGTPYCPEHNQPHWKHRPCRRWSTTCWPCPEETKLMILAPVVANRKGEQLDLFAELRAQGFVRLRVDGKIYEIDALPKLAKSQKHTIDVVVDRPSRCARTCASVSPNPSRPRCAMPKAAPSRSRWTEHRAPVLGQVRLPGLLLRLQGWSRASFRSTTRWAPARSATASASSSSSTRSASSPTPDLSLAAGAIRGWDRRNQFYFQMLNRWPRISASTSTPVVRTAGRHPATGLFGSGRED